MGDTLDEDAFQIQSDILDALADEEMLLTSEIQELNAAFDRRFVDLSKLLDDGAQLGLLHELEDCIEEAQHAMRALSQSREHIAHIGSEEVSRLVAQKEVASLSLMGRRQAVKFARTLHSGASEGSHVMETLKLQTENAHVASQINSLGGELSWRRLQFDDLGKKRRTCTTAGMDFLVPGHTEARELRRSTRNMSVLRAEAESLQRQSLTIGTNSS
jgi:hypothetical protein